MHRATVYLAGKMSGLTLEEMSRWREEAEDMLERSDFYTLSPVRTNFGPNPRDQEITDSNDYQIIHSDIMLAELNHPEISIGTICEIVTAKLQGKPVITWGTAKHAEHPHIRHRTTRHFTELINAVNYIIENYYK